MKIFYRDKLLTIAEVAALPPVDVPASSSDDPNKKSKEARPVTKESKIP